MTEIDVRDLDRAAEVRLWQQTAEERMAQFAAVFGFTINGMEELVQDPHVDLRASITNPERIGRSNQIGQINQL